VVLKLMTYTLAGTAAFFGTDGLPVSGICGVRGRSCWRAMFVLRIQTRWVALALFSILIAAVLFVHGDKGSKQHWR
jgi:uncharacterized membrane protein YphA (DoxX/SURF4 family)